MTWQNLCGPCAIGRCTGQGYGGICEHGCHKSSKPEGVPSSGGKKFTVQRNGFEVQMVWVDEAVVHTSGDALFAPEDAISLGEALILIGRKAQQGVMNAQEEESSHSEL